MDQADELFKAMASAEQWPGPASIGPSLQGILRDATLLGYLVGSRAGLTRRVVRRLVAAECLAEASVLLAALLDGRHDERSFEDALLLADLHAQQDSPEQAYGAHRRALSLAPADPRTLDLARQYLTDQSRFEELADLLAVSAAAAPMAAERARLWRELATLADTQLDDRPRAGEALWRAWEQDECETDAVALKRIYSQEDRWDRYADVLRLQAVRTAQPAPKLDFLRELAQVQTRRLGDARDAAMTWRLVLQLAPDDFSARTQYIDALIQMGDWEAAGTAAVRFARSCLDDQQRIEMLRRVVDTRRGHDDARGLLRALGRLQPLTVAEGELLSDLYTDSQQPGSWLAPVADALGRLLGQGSHGEQSDAPLGLPSGETTCDGAEDTLQIERRAEDLAADDPVQAAQLLATSAQVLLSRDAPAKQPGRVPQERVAVLLRRACELCPPHDGVLQDTLQDTLCQAGLFEDAATLLTRRIGQDADPSRRRSMLLVLAHLYERDLGDLKRAADAMERLVTDEKGDNAALQRLIRLCRVSMDDERLAAALATWYDRGGAASRIEVAEEIATLYAEKLQRPDNAVSWYRRLLDEQPDHSLALGFCRAHAQQQGDHLAVVDMLAQAAVVTASAPARAALYRDAADLAQSELDDPARVASLWSSAAEADPDSAFDGRLTDALGRAEQWEELARFLRSSVSRTSDAEAKVQLYLQLADLNTSRLERPETAVVYLRLANGLQPAQQAIMERLESLYETLGRWRALVAMLQRHADLHEDREHRAQLLHRAATVLLERLDREEEALAVCRRGRELSPTHEALARLMAEIYARRGSWAQAASMLRDRIAAEPDPRRAGRLHTELGQLLLNHLGDPLAAAGHFESALHAGQSRQELLPILRETYVSLGRWDLLIGVLERLAAGDQTEALDAAILQCEVGAIHEEHLDDFDRAEQAYGRAVASAPHYRPALKALRALAVTRRRWFDAVDLARQELGAIDDPSERASLLVEVAGILAEQLQRPEGALEVLQEAVDLDPSNTQATLWLAEGYFLGQHWQGVSDLLEPLLPSVDSLKDIHQHYYRLAYAAEQLGDSDRAFSHYVKAFNRNPLDLPILDRLVDLCYQRHQWQNTVRIIDAIIANFVQEKSAGELANLYVRLGLCEIHLAQREVAVRRLHGLIIGHRQAPHIDEEAWRDTASPWAATLDPRLLRDVDRAVVAKATRAMEQALQCVPTHPRALEVLAASTTARGDWDRALHYLDRAMDARMGDPVAHARLAVCAGDIAAQRLLSTQRAAGYYQRAGRLQPELLLVRTRLEHFGHSTQVRLTDTADIAGRTVVERRGDETEPHCPSPARKRR